MFNTWRLWYRRRGCLKNMRKRQRISWINIIVIVVWFQSRPTTKPQYSSRHLITKSNYYKISNKNSSTRINYLIFYHPRKIIMRLYRVWSNSSPTTKYITIHQYCPQVRVNSKYWLISSCFSSQSIIGLIEWVHFGKMLVENRFWRRCLDYWRCAMRILKSTRKI